MRVRDRATCRQREIFFRRCLVNPKITAHVGSGVFRDQREKKMDQVVDDTVYVQHISNLARLSKAEKKRLQKTIYEHCFTHDVESAEDIDMEGEGFFLRRRGTNELLASFIATDMEVDQLENGRIGHYITWVCTLEPARGQGYMKLLLRSAIAKWRGAGASGPREVSLYVMQSKKAAIHVYTSVGFRIVHNMNMYTKDPKVTTPAHVMYMPLHEEKFFIDSALRCAAEEMSPVLCNAIRELIIEAVTDQDGLAFESDAVLDGPAFYMYALDNNDKPLALMAALVLEPIPNAAKPSSFYISLAYNRSYSKTSGRLGAYYVNELLASACGKWASENSLPKHLFVVANPLQWDTCEALQRVGYKLLPHEDGAEAHLTLKQR
jgi:ribosomal protein S18 acetylase RimI-like enzyme